MFYIFGEKISPKKCDTTSRNGYKGWPKQLAIAKAARLAKARAISAEKSKRIRESTSAAAKKGAAGIASFRNLPRAHIEAAKTRPVAPGKAPTCGCGTCMKPEALKQRRIKAVKWNQGGSWPKSLRRGPNSKDTDSRARKYQHTTKREPTPRCVAWWKRKPCSSR